MNVAKSFQNWTIAEWKANKSGQRVSSGQVGNGDTVTWSFTVPAGVLSGDVNVKENPDLGGDAKFTITKPNGKKESKTDTQGAKFGSTKAGDYNVTAEVSISPGNTTNYDAVLTLAFPK